MISNPANPTTARFLRLYALTLRLYPPAFRNRYAAELLEAARLDLGASPHRLRTFLRLLWDNIRSGFRESIRTPRPITTGQVAFTAAFVLIWFFVVCIFNQQQLRRGADRQPERLTQQLSTQLANNNQPGGIFSAPASELTSAAWLHGSSTFAALYDASGNVIAANATFHGALPQPPRGIFANLRQHSLYKVTWQPQPGVRVALVGRALSNGDFVLAGQSLIPGESAHARFTHGMQSLWLVLLSFLLIMLGAVRLRNRSQTAA